MSNNFDFKVLEKLNLNLSDDKLDLFEKYLRIFLEKNSQLNLISQNDERFLLEKHIFDSLAISKFLKPKSGDKLLDFGTGGGFPAVPISIVYDNLNVYALDSTRKKINAVQDMKEKLNLKNLYPLCIRMEDFEEKFDFVTTRAVASLDKVLQYAFPKLKAGGYFIAYKSQKASEEIKLSHKIIKKLPIKLIKIIEYNLPMEGDFERNLIIFKRMK